MAKHNFARSRLIKKSKVKPRLKKGWWVYLLKCRGGSIYTGISTDVERRVAEHNAGMGSKALRGRRPVKLIYCEKSPNRSKAQIREAEIKRWSSAKKLLHAICSKGVRCEARGATHTLRYASDEQRSR